MKKLVVFVVGSCIIILCSRERGKEGNDQPPMRGKATPPNLRKLRERKALHDLELARTQCCQGDIQLTNGSRVCKVLLSHDFKTVARLNHQRGRILFGEDCSSDFAKAREIISN